MRGIYDGHQANAAFIVCGPPGFTTLALIHLSEHARNMWVPTAPIICTSRRRSYSLAHHPELRLDGDVWYSCNVVAALMLYGLAVFFFFFDILPYWNKLHRQRQGLHEILRCESLFDLLCILCVLTSTPRLGTNVPECRLGASNARPGWRLQLWCF